jgi:hypothetical protein
MTDTPGDNLPTPAQLAQLAILISGDATCARYQGRHILINDATQLWFICMGLLKSGSKLTGQECNATIEELTTLAATLGQYADEEIYLGTLARDAVTMWCDCKKHLDSFRKRRRSGVVNPIKEYRLAAENPPGGKYPAPLSKALLELMPKKRVPDREFLFRKYLTEWSDFPWPVGNGGVNPPPNDPIAEIARLRTHGVTSNEWGYHSPNFRQWLHAYTKKQNQIRARKGGEGKAKKLKPGS